MGVLFTNEDKPETIVEKLSMKTLGFLIPLNNVSNQPIKLKLSFKALVMKINRNIVMIDSLAAWSKRSETGIILRTVDSKTVNAKTDVGLNF